MRILILLFAGLATAAVAQPPDGDWVHPWGAGDLEWGTSNQPIDALPKDRREYLPDAGYIGRNPADRPDDMRVTEGTPAGERRYLRYVHGALVDAWLVREGPIDAARWAVLGTEQWRGPAIGPSTEDGWRAIGDAVRWQVDDRTVLHWKDRTSTLEILANRAAPTGQYGVEHEGPLEEGHDGTSKSRVSGEMKKWAKPFAMRLSGCFDQSPKPVEAHISLRFDELGRPALLKVNADQTAFNATACVAGVLHRANSTPNSSGQFSLFRMH